MAFLWLPAGASLGVKAFLSLHMAAAIGHLVATSLMPETIFLPAQTGQPVLPFITERTTLKILLSNSCPQSVVKVFEDKLPIDDETLMKLTAGYAAGMGCMESTCGALIGAVMVAGILTDGKGTPRISKELVQNFERKCGATICKDLKGIETGKVLCPCPECVRNAVLSLGEALGE